MSLRRTFLQQTLAGSAAVGFSGAMPQFLSRASAAASQQEKILVVVQLSGGNDGLNSLVPYADDAYYRQRPKLAIPAGDLLKIDDHLGWHPGLRGFADLLEADQLAVVQGVGYASPNRSHFESMDIWHTGFREEEQQVEGWLGRTLDQLPASSGSNIPALHLGQGKQPLALVSRDHRVPSIQSLEQFRLQDVKKQKVATLQELSQMQRAESDSLLSFVQSSTSTAIDVSQKFESSRKEYQTETTYPESRLGGQMKTIAQMIRSDLAARIYYVTLDGFDTHAQQANSHAALLREVGDAVTAFTQDMVSHGEGDRVLTVCFSEFGRRVAENASGGTDHGTAAPMFLAGGNVKAGLVGQHPSLNDLQQGDLKHHTDFRQVYAGILENWLHVSAAEVLGKSHRPIQLFA